MSIVILFKCVIVFHIYKTGLFSLALGGHRVFVHQKQSAYVAYMWDRCIKTKQRHQHVFTNMDLHSRSFPIKQVLVLEVLFQVLLCETFLQKL